MFSRRVGDLAGLYPKLAAAHAAMVDSPSHHVAHCAIAKRAPVHHLPCHDASIFDPKAVAALLAVIYLARTHNAADCSITKRTRVVECAAAPGSTALGSAAGGGSPSIRAPAPRPCPCRRPSVVTEGYIRLPPLPPTHLVLTSCRFRFAGPGAVPCHLQCILRVVFKNLVFYRVSWPSLALDFVLATLKNHGFFMVLGLRTGSGTENWTS